VSDGQSQQPDWNQIAGKFDLWLPYIEPVNRDLMASISISENDHVLDLACGTGEPGLSIAQAFGAANIHVTACDAAQAMVDVAEKKAEQLALKNMNFISCPAEQLIFSDQQFDKIVCRFGLMLFKDPEKGLTEIKRVMKPGASAALTVWSRPEKMPSMYWFYQAFKAFLPEEQLPPLKVVTSLGVGHALENLFAAVGFSHVNIERRNFDFCFNNVEALWDLTLRSDVMQAQFDAIDEKKKQIVKQSVFDQSAEFFTQNGLVMPTEYILVNAVK